MELSEVKNAKITGATRVALYLETPTSLPTRHQWSGAYRCKLLMGSFNFSTGLIGSVFFILVKDKI